MVTIYLDKQVFSHLFKEREEKYSLLREKILSHKDEFIFFYSNAHLFDLQDDETDIKYSEMDFMQSIVVGNRLIYENSRQEVMKLAPCDAFETIGKIDDFSWLENFDVSQITEEQRNIINNIVDIGVKDLNGDLEFDWLTKRTPISADKLLVDMQSFISLMKLWSYNFYENKKSYKILRENTIAKYNPTSITAESESVLNEQLILSSLGLSFLDVVKATLVQIGLTSTDFAMVYYTSYMLLDLFGINKETRKKVKFRNMQIDACHSFFGSYCDCVVSNDEGLVRKSKILYKLFNIGAKVYSIDEFIDKFDEAISNNKKSVCDSFDEIINDYAIRQVIRTATMPEHTLTYLNASNKYFGYFSGMIEIRSKNEADIILYKGNDLNQPLLAKEIEIIVNRLVRAFNDIGATLPLFDEAVEMPLIRTDSWYRVLMLGDADVYLTKLKDVPMLCLWIKLNQPISQTQN